MTDTEAVPPVMARGVPGKLSRGLARASTWSILLFARVAEAQFKLPAAPPGLPSDSLPALIARIIKASLLLVAVLALGFIVYGGFRYILSRGDETEVKTAKQIITYAIVGIVFIGLAYALVSFVFQAVLGQS